jgi:cytochrome c553
VQPSIAGLAGLPRDYINAQFGNWRNHTRRAQAPDCMALVANRLSLADVAAVSGWIAQRPLPADMSAATTVSRPLPLACGSAPEPSP